MTAATAHPDKPAGRGLVILGFLVTTLFTGAVTCAVGFYNTAYQAVRTERTAQVDKFVQAAGEFDPLVRSFVADEKAGVLTPKTRTAVRDNLLKQREALDSVRSVAPASSLIEIDEYEATLGRADDGAKSAVGPLDSQKFVQEAVHIAEQRNVLFKKLRAPPSLLLN